jgi:murein DD-endopeptidase MepM/ murein hydrolase activator NlpD
VRCLPRRTTALATLLGALLVVAVPATADARSSAEIRNQKHSVDQKVSAAKNDLDDISSSLIAASKALDATQAKVRAAQVDLNAKQAAAALAQAHNAQVAEQLSLAEAAEAQANDDLAATQHKAVQTNNVLGALARRVYQGSDMSTLSVALNAKSPDDFATGMALADTASRIETEALRQLGVQRAEEAATTAKLTAARQEVAVLSQQAVAALAAANDAAQQAAAAKAALDGLAAQQAAEVAAVEAQKAAERKRLSELQSQSNHLRLVLARLAAKEHGGIWRRTGGLLSYPVIGPLSSPFGLRFHPILHYWRMHTGQDFAVACGTPVHAAASGRIVSHGWAGGYGNEITIDHGRLNGKGLATTYNHLSRFVRTGGHVTRGEVIAYSGTTGLSTGCHLHFEVRINGVPVNPMPYL